jgi:hypothetical protein
VATSAGSKGRADPAPWISVQAPDGCDAARDLGDRVARALVGPRAAELRAWVTIDERFPGYRAEVRITRGSVTLGSKVVTVPTCEEAAEAAVVVLALALSEKALPEPAPVPEPEPAPSDPSTLAGAPSPAVKPAARSLRAAVEPNGERPERDSVRSTKRRNAVRATLSTGVDTGTISLPTAYLGAGFTRVLEPVELRAVVRFGVPHVEEEETDGEAARSEVLRRDFGALDLSACYALGASWRFSACAGGELGVIRTQERRVEGQVEVDTDSADPRISGVLTALIARRAGTVQPELELSSLAVAAGRPEQSPWLALRAGVGVAMQF